MGTMKRSRRRQEADARRALGNPARYLGGYEPVHWKPTITCYAIASMLAWETNFVFS